MFNELRWIKPSIQLLEAFVIRDLEQASKLAGIGLDPFLISDDVVWLWQLRLEEAYQDAGILDWTAQLVVWNEQVIGHAGFHGPPDESGRVEVAYFVIPTCRGRGMAKLMLKNLLQRANEEPEVNLIRASIRPDNAASLAIIRSFSFTQVGEQWDDVDGLELVFEIRKSNDFVI